MRQPRAAESRRGCGLIRRRLYTPLVAQLARFRQRRRRASTNGCDMHPDDKPSQTRALVVLLRDALDGEPRAAVLRPGSPPLAFESVQRAVAEASAWVARQ